MRLPLPGPAAVVSLVAAAAGTIVLVASSYRVQPGSLAVAGGRLAGPGWHLKAPFSDVRIIPGSGRLGGIDIDRTSEEGASIRVRLALDYQIAAATLAGRAAELQAEGLEGFVARVAGESMADTPPAALLPPDLTDAAGGQAPLPQPVLEAISGRLRAAGIEPVRLTARVGAAAAFAPASPGRPSEDTASGASGGGVAMPVAEPTGLRLLMIGLDGADWDIIDPLLRQGRLPNLAGLVQNGVRGALRSYDPMISPLLWTTMVTGVGPDVHGVADFQAIQAATGRRVPITSRFRKVKALWNILGDAGRRSGFIAWWASYPAERVAGYQVSNLVVYESLRPKPAGAPAPAGITFPQEYFSEIRPRLQTVEALRFEDVRGVLRIDGREFEEARKDVLRAPGPDEEGQNRRMVQRPVSLALTILAGSRNYAAIAADLAARRLDLTAVYFEGIDMMGHRFQHCMPPRMAICPDQDYARYRDAVAYFYARQDALLGPILEAAGDGATVMVVSDHGFKSGAGRPVDILPYTTEQPVEWHDEEGIFLLSGPGARRGERLAGRATLFDIAPTILYLLGLPASEEMPGRVLLEAIDPAFAGEHRVRTIPSYETVGGPREILSAEGPGAHEAEEELLANLRALGYIGGDDGGARPVPAAPQSPGEAPAGPGADTQVFYHRNLATYFMKRREYARAAEQLRRANERQKLPKNYQLLSEALMAMGRTDEAIAVLHEGLETIDIMDPESVLWLVRIRLGGAGGRVAAREEARRWASRTAMRPGLDEAIAGLLKEDEGDRGGAAELYWRSLDSDPTRAVVAQRLYALEAERGAGARLEPVLRRALAKDPRLDEYHNLLGAILSETGRPGEALESFRRAVDLDPDNPRFAANLAAGLARAELWDEAAAAYERAAALSPAAGTYMRLGSVYRRLKRPDRALAAFERARVLGDAGSGPLLGIALSRAEMNQIPEALSVVRQGLDRHPGDRALRSLYDDLLRRRGSPGSAPDRTGPGR